MIKRKLTAYYNYLVNKSDLTGVKSDIDFLRINQGKILSENNLNNKVKAIKNDISKAEFKIFSQWGDDGIINFLVNYLEIEDKRFIEFGVENYKECNTRFLLVNDNWSGLIMDGSKEHMDSVKKENIYWQYDLQAEPHFITTSNINNLFLEYGFEGEIGLLHIDIDGNDYWVWKEIEVVNPIIVIVEYNSLFGFKNPYTVPYKEDFYRTRYHYSNLVYGSSLLSLNDLAEEKGYFLVGCNTAGNNAYFIRKDRIKDIGIKTVEQAYVLSKFKESRNAEGNLSFTRGLKRFELIKGVEVYNTRTNQIEKL